MKYLLLILFPALSFGASVKKLPTSRGGTGNDTSYSSGSMLFSNGSTVSENNSKLFWDNTNFRIGVGTASPSTAISLNGNADQIIGLEANTSTDPGSLITLKAGDAKSGATDSDGGNIILKTGQSTGFGNLGTSVKFKINDVITASSGTSYSTNYFTSLRSDWDLSFSAGDVEAATDTNESFSYSPSTNAFTFNANNAISTFLGRGGRLKKVNYTFTVSSANYTAGDVYQTNGDRYTVQGSGTGVTTLVAKRTTINTAAPTASGTLTKVSGSGDATITYSSFITATATPSFTIAGHRALQNGLNQDGGNMVIQSGIPTGSGQATIFFQTPDIGASGTADRSTMVRRLSIGSAGDVIQGNFTTALATNANNGFFQIASMNGTPTGAPSVVASSTPITVDKTNNKFYFYSGGSWRSALSSVNLTSDVSGILPIANGGTNNSSAYSAGSIIFSDGTKLTQDTDLTYDATNKRIGLGVAPAYALDITQTAVASSTAMHVKNSDDTTGAQSLFRAENDVGNVLDMGILSSADSSSSFINSVSVGDFNIGAGSKLVFKTDGLQRAYITENGSVVVSNGSTLSGAESDGFMYIHSANDFLSGAPTTQAGASAISVDTLHDIFGFFTNGVWRSVKESHNGTYTPTFFSTVNLDSNPSVSGGACSYMSVGSTAMVSCSLAVDPTANTTTTSFEMSVPFGATTLKSSGSCTGGDPTSSTVQVINCYIEDGTSPRVKVSWHSGTTTLHNLTVQFMFNWDP